MSNLFKISEVVDMGIEKEKARREFYDTVSKEFKEKEIKELFGQLRDWEEAHIRKFTEIRNLIIEDDAVQTYPGELSDYMRSLVDDKLYKKVAPKEFSKSVKDTSTAIRLGIGFEKDAILFFLELAKFAADSQKDIINKLVDEEKQHILYLVGLKKKLVK